MVPPSCWTWKGHCLVLLSGWTGMCQEGPPLGRPEGWCESSRSLHLGWNITHLSYSGGRNDQVQSSQTSHNGSAVMLRAPGNAAWPSRHPEKGWPRPGPGLLLPHETAPKHSQGHTSHFSTGSSRIHKYAQNEEPTTEHATLRN